MKDNPEKPGEEETLYVSPEGVEKLEHLLDNMEQAQYELKKAIERVKPVENPVLSPKNLQP